MKKSWYETYTQYKNIFWKNYNYYKEKENVKNFIELSLTLAAIIIFSVFAIKPTAITIIELLKEIKAKEETIRKMSIKITNLQKAQSLISQEQEAIKIINRSLPSEPDPEIIIRQAQAVSSESNSEIGSISVSRVSLTKTKKTNTGKTNLPANTDGFDLSISINGKYENLMKALELYEKLERTTIINQFSFSKKQTEEEKEILSLNMNITVPYYFQSAKAVNNNEKAVDNQNIEENIIKEQ